MSARLHAILVAAAPGLALIILGLCGAALGYRLNTTPSVPIGLWKIDDGAALKRGDHVGACIPPDAPMMQRAIERRVLRDGLCDGGFAPLIKRIVAIAGDQVLLTDEVVIVNGTPIPGTRTLNSLTTQGAAPSARGLYRVGPDQFWLIANDHPLSFDSRYYGPVERHSLRYRMRPVWTVRSHTAIRHRPFHASSSLP